jgi:NAD(P)-dependent dehydrogenase (short-subunit alcohol dehydrogenase family)
MAALRDTIALVTGASRGAGRAIALELGAAGATVYVTGRTAVAGTGVDGLPGTIHETAAGVTERGGRGIAVHCDHTADDQVAALFERIGREQSRLDLLVNNVWGGYENPQCKPLPVVPFWEQPLGQWDGMFTAGVRAYVTASRLAVPLMLPQRRGLIVNTSANLEPLPYLRNLFYDVAKHAVTRMTMDMAHDLREHGITAVAVAPGFMRTERIEAAFRRAGYEAALDGPGGPKETPAYLGRAVAALASDPRVLEKTGQLLEVGALAHEYGFTDVNGSQPPPFRIVTAGGSK